MAEPREWGIDLEKLRARIDKEVAQARQEYYERIEQLRREIDEYVRELRPEVRGAMEAQLAAWRTQLGELIASARAEKREARRLLEEIDARRRAAKARLKELTHSGGQAWGELKVGLERAWAELRPALDRALAKFK